VKVIVIGGGVGGMSAAHELAARGFEVVVYEQRAIAGGKARSVDAIPGTGGRRALPGEHGFRFFPGSTGTCPTRCGASAIRAG
jgi:15-cis-phytoene desaturase